MEGLLLCPDMKSIFGTGNSNIPSLWTWKHTKHTHTQRGAHTHSCVLTCGTLGQFTPQTGTRRHGKCRDNTWPTPAACLDTFSSTLPAGNVPLCDVRRRRLSNNSPAGCLERPPCASVTPGFCFLRALPGPSAFPLSAAHVER